MNAIFDIMLVAILVGIIATICLGILLLRRFVWRPQQPQPVNLVVAQEIRTAAHEAAKEIKGAIQHPATVEAIMVLAEQLGKNPELVRQAPAASANILVAALLYSENVLAAQLKNEQDNLAEYRRQNGPLHPENTNVAMYQAAIAVILQELENIHTAITKFEQTGSIN